MNEPTIRLFDAGRDMEKLDWLKRNRERNHYYERILTYPATRLLVADPMDGGECTMIIPVQSAYIMESVGPNPKATPAQVGAALRQVTSIVKWETLKAGGKQVFFFASEPTIRNFALRHEAFEEMSAQYVPLRLELP